MKHAILNGHRRLIIIPDVGPRLKYIKIDFQSTIMAFTKGFT